MGFGPQLVDLDHDGHIDLISGSWPGELFLFHGGPDRTFAAPEMLKDKRGEVMNLFGGWKEENDGERWLTGNGEIVEQEDGRFVRYHDELFESTPERPIVITGSATTVNAFDWDGDGDEDLIVGDIDGRVVLVPNEGTAKQWAFGERQDLQVGGAPITVSGDAGPYVADWDGNALPDLLVGSGDGSVTWYRNTGTRAKPVLSQGVEIVARVNHEGEIPKTPSRGIRSKICAVDWNGDGKLDLLVGDFARMKANLPEPTPEERAVHEQVRKEIEGLRNEFASQLGKLRGPNRVRDRAERKTERARLDDLSDRIVKLGESLPNEDEEHGWVWLFLRR